MPITIHRLFNLQKSNTNEVKAAIDLCRNLESYLPDEASGNIYILPSMVCPSARNKDLDLVAWFDTSDLFLEVNSGYRKNTGIQENFPLRRKVRIDTALLIFELKSHNTYHSIKIENQHLYLKYPDGYHDVTEQSNGQKFALINFFQSKLPTSKIPFVVNLIWLNEAENIHHHDQNLVENILWGNSNPKKIFEIVFRYNLPVEDYGGQIIYDACQSDSARKETTDYFKVLSKNSAVGIGKISRKKVNELIRKDISEMEKHYFNFIGDKFTFLKGNPGTGKTVHLIHLAHNLYHKRGLKCLILTFNKALQQDIKRLIYHSGLDQNNIDIMTWDSFIFRCLTEYEKPEDQGFDRWTDRLVELTKGDDNARELFKTALAFEVALIDEGQDWSDNMKNLVFKLFGSKYTVVAIGEGQEYTQPQEWDFKKFSRDKRQKFELEVSHRNKRNIVDFLNEYGNNRSYDWQISRNDKLTGGRLIAVSDYTYGLHKELINDLQNNENSFYDLMFLGGTSSQMNEIGDLLKSFGHQGFIFNTPENRNKSFPLDEFRIISYQACRGLEGWTVVCYELDVFLQTTLKFDTSNNYDKTVKNFLLIIFTRAIDTLVITFKDIDSKNSQIILSALKELGGKAEIRI